MTVDSEISKREVITSFKEAQLLGHERKKAADAGNGIRRAA